MIDQGLGLKVSPYDDLLAPSIVTRNTKWNYTFVFFHYTWWRSASDDCSQWHNSYVTNTFVALTPPPSYFIKMTLIFICVNITINKLFSFYWPIDVYFGTNHFHGNDSSRQNVIVHCLSNTFETIDTWILVCVITVLFLSTQIFCPFQNIMNVYHYLKLSYVFENNAKK